MILLSKEKVKPYFEINNESAIDILIKGYYNYCNTNLFNDLKCPCCKKTGLLHFHKTYERNIIYMVDDEIVEDTINITVLVCEHCKKNNNCQKYHALLPFFIFPYHQYSSNTIIGSIYDRIINDMKLEAILEKVRITHKLFYDWIRKVNKYLLSSSIILKIKTDIKLVVEKIYKLNEKFLMEFYDAYNHPYFLFKLTCVPLRINP